MNKTKVLITGSNGLLGQHLVKLFVENNYEVIATSKGKNRAFFNEGYHYVSANITNFDIIYKLIKREQPNFIINAAAMTNVDACELRQRECKEINAKAVKNIAIACQEFDIHLIQISTDFVFKGKKGFYKEDDKTNPVNFYGEMKLKAEKYVQKYCKNYSILRTIILYGYIQNSSRNNFVLWVKESLENNKLINVVTDQFRMPTNVKMLSNACLQAVKNKSQGVFHISSKELLSIYEMSVQIADTFKLNKQLINPILTEKLNQKAKRPKKTGFILDKSISELNLKATNFRTDLISFKKELNNI